MRYLMLTLTTFLCWTAQSAHAQTQGGVGGSGGIGSGGGIGTGSRIGATSGGTSFGGGSGFSGGAGGAGAAGGAGFAGALGGGMGAAGRTATGGATAIIPSTVNPYYTYYVNPLGLGLKPSVTSGVTAQTNNGFGKALYAITGAASTVSNLNNMNTNSGTGFTTFGTIKAPSYVTTLHNKMPMALYAPARLHADVSESLVNSGYIGDRKIDVALKGNVVVLKGQVQDADERRLVEGMVWLTPGVRGVQNELTYPVPLPPPTKIE